MMVVFVQMENSLMSLFLENSLSHNSDYCEQMM